MKEQFFPDEASAKSEFLDAVCQSICQSLTTVTKNDFVFNIRKQWDVYRITIMGKLSMIAIKLEPDGTGSQKMVVGFVQPGVHHTKEAIAAFLYGEQ